ncbi:MAG: DinB family protein [Chitinophagales bacterium]
MQKTKLLRQFNALEASRTKLLTDLRLLRKEVLTFKPAADKWSVNQVLYHLFLAESASAAYASKKMLGGTSIKKTGAAASIRSSLLSLVLRSGYKWKAPAMLGSVPEDVDFEEVVQRWDDSRGRLKSFIEGLPDNLLEREIYKHPRAGRLNAGQMVQFFEDHFEHHLAQIKRLKKGAAAKDGSAKT